jgi:hypothetical protein
VRLDGLEVHEHLAFVVSGAARVDFAVTDRGLERRRLPELDGVHRLHVVMAVEQDGGSIRSAQPVAIDDREAWRVDEPDVLQADPLHLVCRPFRTRTHVVGMLREGADARDREVSLQFLDVAVAIGVDEIDDGVHGCP